jgi:hypothetical protein
MKWKNLPKDQPICLTSSWFYASFDEHEDKDRYDVMVYWDPRRPDPLYCVIEGEKNHEQVAFLNTDQAGLTRSTSNAR